VTDHHNSSITKNAHLDQAPNITYQKQPSTTTVLPQTKMAVSKGGTLTLGSKRPLITAADSVPPASQATTIPNQGRELTPATISEPSMAQSVDESKLPPRLNLRELGLRGLERIKALQQKAHNPAHVARDPRTKRSMSASIITLFSFVSHVTIPDHELLTHATLSDHKIKQFEEFNEHYNGTKNQIHFLSFSTDISSNKVFTHKEAITQEDTLLFVEAMQKEVADHELGNHWTIVHCSTVPRIAKPFQAILSFKCKRCPDGTLVKHKARQCAHGRMQQWGTNYWETYSPVVNMVTVRLILLLARICKLESKAIDFVLTFPQAEFDVDIWMYLLLGFQVDTENECKCYILKLNKSLYGLKQASLNWFKKLKQGLIDHGFHPSAIDPCLHFKKGMLIITYIDDCIIISNSIKDINTFVKSIKDGPEGYVLTDEGDINKFLGIEIKEITKNKFKLS
jgi:hypothetical protein